MLLVRDWYPPKPDSTTTQHVALVSAGFVALILALWRGRINERQAAAAEQAVTDGRYQRGVEMLASDTLSGRLGGIYSLRNLAEAQPEQHHIQVMRVLCAFVRHPPPYDTGQAARDSGRAEAEANRRMHVHGRPRGRADVQAAMDTIGLRSQSGIAIEREIGFTLDLSGADLSRADLEKADLSGADLTFANLYGAVFYKSRLGPAPPRSRFYLRLLKLNPGTARPLRDNYADEEGWRQTYTANLSGADLSYATLSRARMEHVNLSRAEIREATLSGARLGFSTLRGANLFESVLSPLDVLYTDLSSADLTDANLQNSNCSAVDMTGTVLHGVGFGGTRLWAATMNSAELTDDGHHPPIGLTQGQLDQTIVTPGNHPDLKGVVDARTGEALIWRDAIPHDEKYSRVGICEWMPEDESEGSVPE